MTYLKALREDAPLLDAYLSYFEVTRTPFTIPGHKQRASKLDLGLGAVVDGDTPLFFDVHRIEHLLLHIPGFQAAAMLDQAVGQRRFAVVDVGNDAEVADPRGGNVGHAGPGGGDKRTE